MAQTASTSSPRPSTRLGRIGIWSNELRSGDVGARADAAAELDELGFGALWIPGATSGDLLDDVAVLLAATRRATIATGILNIWKHEPADVGAWWGGLSGGLQARTMLGLGVSHALVIGADYGRPVASMNAYLDKLDAAGVPEHQRCLAALGPKMLDLARDRSAGAHPFLITPEHTAMARERLGPTALLAPEQGVILETDPSRARDIARRYVSGYGQLANYSNSWRRLGFSEEDITTSSDRLCDALFAWGDVDQIARRVDAHLAAGADHVCLQVSLGGAGEDLAQPREIWRELAAALI